MNKMDKKGILLVGGSSDIGREWIRCNDGGSQKIVAHYHSVPVPASSENVTWVQGDFGNTDSTARFMEKCKMVLDCPEIILFLAAPRPRLQRFHEIKPEEFLEQQAIQLYAPIMILRHFLPKMADKKRGGKVIFMLSSLTVTRPPSGMSAYAIAKYAVLGLMHSLASDYAKRGMEFYGVSPSMVDTKFISEFPDMIKAQLASQRPNGKNLTVSDVIPVLDFLISDKCHNMSGINLPIS